MAHKERTRLQYRCGHWFVQSTMSKFQAADGTLLEPLHLSLRSFNHRLLYSLKLQEVRRIRARGIAIL